MAAIGIATVLAVRGPIRLAPANVAVSGVRMSNCSIRYCKSGETFPLELLPHFQTHSRSNSVSRSHSRPRAFKLSATFSLAIQFATTCNKVLYLRPAHSLPYLFISFTPSPATYAHPISSASSPPTSSAASFTDTSQPAASSCVSHVRRTAGAHISHGSTPWEVFPHRYRCRTQCVSLIPFSPSEWRGADDIFLVVCFW